MWRFLGVGNGMELEAHARSHLFLALQIHFSFFDHLKERVVLDLDVLHRTLDPWEVLLLQQLILDLVMTCWNIALNCRLLGGPVGLREKLYGDLHHKHIDLPNGWLLGALHDLWKCH